MLVSQFEPMRDLISKMNILKWNIDGHFLMM